MPKSRRCVKRAICGIPWGIFKERLGPYKKTQHPYPFFNTNLGQRHARFEGTSLTKWPPRAMLSPKAGLSLQEVPDLDLCVPRPRVVIHHGHARGIVPPPHIEILSEQIPRAGRQLVRMMKHCKTVVQQQGGSWSMGGSKMN